VPTNIAKELSFQVASEVSGAEAARLGFANHSHPAVELATAVRGLAERIARTPPDLLRIKKEAINGVANRAGFRETLMQAPLWDALAHTSRSVDGTRALINERGIKGAIAHYAG
jgi:enoyl-CoA hydratase